MSKCVLFIGSGECGREVMAKAVLDQHIRNGECVPVEVKARGLVVLFQEPVNSKIVQILLNNDAPMEYDCVFQLEQADIDSSDLIITMDEAQKERVKEHYQNVENIYTLKELAGESSNMLDPYGKELMDYEYCYREIHRLVDVVIEKHL
ncbi:MAG: hypothetical protein J6D02_00455 [Lachnospira sp.]|nr:hypothetical protein [Lachnospira sp.]